MKIALMLLPLSLLAGGAFADDVMRAVPTEARPAPAAASAEPAAKPKRRQGADMRHCLELKDNKAIIRCAESGRRP